MNYANSVSWGGDNLELVSITSLLSGSTLFFFDPQAIFISSEPQSGITEHMGREEKNFLNILNIFPDRDFQTNKYLRMDDLETLIL